MSEVSLSNIPPPDPALSGKAAIIGIGESDYHADYQAQRARTEGYQPPSVESLCQTAFDRALADSGLRHADIDGISTSFTYGGPAPLDLAKQMGLNPRYAINNGNILAGPLQRVCADIASGKADRVAMVYAVASRAIGRTYGGKTYDAAQMAADSVARTPATYYYYHPWGFSSQAAHWALMFQAYRNDYGYTEADLGTVAMQLRQHARTNPNAVMQQAMGLDDYLAARYIVRPMRLFDMCLVNDGAVCLIVSRADLASDAAQDPVLVAGWGEAKVKHSKLHAMLRQRLHPMIADAGRQALDMAGIALSDIGHFEGYDASSFHLIDQLEGLGFCPPGEGLRFCRDGQMTLGGAVPTNLAGGMLSGSYMHGWNLAVECVRQLRHQAGARQVRDVQHSLFNLAQTDQSHPIVFKRGVAA